MVQTREEKNKRASQARFTKQYARYESWRSTIMELWIRAKKEKMSHEAILKYRNEWIYGQLAYQTLPVWIKNKLEGVYDVLYKMTYRLDLTFCYPHPDTGIITDSHILCNDGFASRIDTNTGNHYWKNDDGTFTHGF